jgi:hypothetical protein
MLMDVGTVETKRKRRQSIEILPWIPRQLGACPRGWLLHHFCMGPSRNKLSFSGCGCCPSLLSDAVTVIDVNEDCEVAGENEQKTSSFTNVSERIFVLNLRRGISRILWWGAGNKGTGTSGSCSQY